MYSMKYLVLLCSLHVVKIVKVLNLLIGLIGDAVLPEEFSEEMCD